MRGRMAMLSLSMLMGCESGRIVAGTLESERGGANGLKNPCSNQVSVGSAPMRRLSHREYEYSLTDVLDGALTPTVQTQASTLVPDPISLGFKNSASFLSVTPILANDYMEAAEKVSAAAVTTANLGKLVGCTPSGDGSACAAQFIKTFGARLYRRALTTDELAAYQKVYTTARGQYDFATGIQWVVFTFLQAPGFLYRAELDAANGAAVRALTSQELAVRLSYLVWQSVPDETLTAAATQGRLVSKADLEREARRMLQDAKAQRSFDFYSQWLNLDSLDSYTRDSASFPSVSQDLPALFSTEVQQFVANVMKGDAKLSTLLTAPYTYVNGDLAKHYGFTQITGSTWQKAEWPQRRGGLFMLSGVLTNRDKSTRTSIVRRGLTMRTQALCQLVPAPPANVPALGPIDATVSQADRLAQHRKDPACSACHVLLDPLGNAFENIDAVGRFRATDEAGHPTLTAGELQGLTDEALNGPVADGYEIFTRYANSSDATTCFATQFYRFSVGRKEEPADACSRWTLNERFVASGGNINELIVGLTQTDDFMNKPVSTP